jgi:hypothetical protein
VLIRAVSVPNLESPTVLDSLLVTDSWQTIITFAREHARTCFFHRSSLITSTTLTFL